MSNIDGLKNLQEVYSIDFGNTNIANLDGLRSLHTINGSADFMETKITNVNGLSNLKNISEVVNLYKNPSLQDISGLNNIEHMEKNYLGAEIYVDAAVYFDDRPYEVKLDANSYLCQNFETKVRGVNNKSYICNP